MVLPTGLALYASGVAPSGFRLVSEHHAGLFDAELNVTIACDYKNDNDDFKSGREIKVANFPHLDDGTSYTEPIFEGTGYLSSGNCSPSQGTLICSSGVVSVLEMNPTGCSYQSGETCPVNLVLLHNLEAESGAHVRFGPFYNNYTDYVDGVLYTDYFMCYKMKPQGMWAVNVHSAVEKLGFVATSGVRGDAVEKKASIKYTLFPS